MEVAAREAREGIFQVPQSSVVGERRMRDAQRLTIDRRSIHPEYSIQPGNVARELRQLQSRCNKLSRPTSQEATKRERFGDRGQERYANKITHPDLDRSRREEGRSPLDMG